MRTIKATIFCLLLSFVGQAQSLFSGTVVDSENNPLPGATVVVRGGNGGTATDFDGIFEIEVSPGDILVISYLGPVPLETTWTPAVLPASVLTKLVLVVCVTSSPLTC